MNRHYASHLRAVRGLLVLGVAASLGSATMQWIAPWPLKFIFDSVILHQALPQWFHYLPRGSQAHLWELVGAMAFVALALALADFYSTKWVASAGQRVIFGIRGDLFRHLEAQSAAFYHERHVGDLLSRLGGDVQAIQSAVVTALPTLVRNVFTLFGVVVIMFFVDWRFALLALTLIPLLALASHYFLRSIKSIQRRARRADGDASAVAQEVLTSLQVVQAFGAEEREAQRYEAATGRGLEENRRAIVAQAQFTPLVTLVMTLATVIMLYFGVLAIRTHQLTPGDLLVLMAYLRGTLSPIRQLSKLAGVVGRAGAANERVLDILSTHEEVPETPRPRRRDTTRGELHFSDVWYSYPTGEPVLRGATLHVPAGSRHALVGYTGSGKSTLLRLVPRFIDPQRGSVHLDGVDTRELALADLRRSVALVTQEPYLFRGTVWENILYGAESPRREQALDLARRVGLFEVIDAFPRGFDTVIGERGLSLSGGQRQCVSLTRALARQAPLLLLDEPTVGLDAELEHLVLHALDTLLDGATSVLVTHHLASLHRVDTISVLLEGRLVEEGPHAALVARGGHYQSLVQTAQASGRPRLDPPRSHDLVSHLGELC